jgi:hypothetical protein
VTTKPQPCPNAKKHSGRHRFVHGRQYKYQCPMSCAICHGSGMTIACYGCEGCGLHQGVICPNCRGCGRLPDDAKGAPFQAPLA